MYPLGRQAEPAAHRWSEADDDSVGRNEELVERLLPGRRLEVEGHDVLATPQCPRRLWPPRLLSALPPSGLWSHHGRD